METRLSDIFMCERCRFWYPGEERGPYPECKCCFWGVPINKRAIITVKQVVVMMARELEELLATG